MPIFSASNVLRRRLGQIVELATDGGESAFEGDTEIAAALAQSPRQRECTTSSETFVTVDVPQPVPLSALAQCHLR